MWLQLIRIARTVETALRVRVLVCAAAHTFLPIAERCSFAKKFSNLPEGPAPRKSLYGKTTARPRLCPLPKISGIYIISLCSLDDYDWFDWLLEASIVVSLSHSTLFEKFELKWEKNRLWLAAVDRPSIDKAISDKAKFTPIPVKNQSSSLSAFNFLYYEIFCEKHEKLSQFDWQNAFLEQPGRRLV